MQQIFTSKDVDCEVLICAILRNKSNRGIHQRTSMLSRGLVIVMLLFSTTAHAQRPCAADEVTFTFNNIDLRQAFAILADFSKTKLKIDESIVWSGPMGFTCKPWKQAAQDLANAHSLHLQIQDGTMVVTK